VAAVPTFAQRLRSAIDAVGSLLCVGLDPDITEHPDAAAAERFCQRMLDETLVYACAVKPNLAFFEQHGSAGWAILERLRARVPADRILILDGKRGDIGSTAKAYVRALFDVLGADAVTVNPLMGRDAVAPFLEREGRGVFLVTRSSNPGAADLFEQPVGSTGGALYQRIVELGLAWDPGGAVGYVVGATAPEAIARVRSAAPAAPILAPGVGSQGGALEDSVAAGLNVDGGGLLISVSRGIGSGSATYADAARQLRDRIEAARAAVAA
jgi:orotidine 5'-phosphate decarboxylase subfamily 2